MFILFYFLFFLQRNTWVRSGGCRFRVPATWHPSFRGTWKSSCTLLPRVIWGAAHAGVVGAVVECARARPDLGRFPRFARSCPSPRGHGRDGPPLPGGKKGQRLRKEKKGSILFSIHEWLITYVDAVYYL